MNKIAVVGVMDSLGRELLNFLADDGFDKKDVVALDTNAQLGTIIGYGEEEDIDVINLESFDFAGIKIAIFATKDEVSKKYVPKALAGGAKVVDCSSYYFGNQDVPMIVAGVNDNQVLDASKNLVSVPSAAVTQILLPLAKIDEEYVIKRIVASTYTSTSLYGKEGMDELFSQTRKIFMNDSVADSQKVFNKQIAFNVLPQVDEFIGEETKSEWAINAEIKKTLGKDIKVHANCAFVPAFIGSGIYVNVECKNELDVDKAKELIKQTKNVVVFDKNANGGYVSLNDVQGEIEVYVSRLRQDVSVENGFSFWSVADNLRFGIAGNAFNIMKFWLKN